MTESSNPNNQHIGLVLPGGGARAAYQVGVLRAIADLLPARNPSPFGVVTGTSAGSINATEVAIHAERFRIATLNLERVWRNFQVNQVFYADSISMMRSGLSWFAALVSAGWLRSPPKSLLDNYPLRELLTANLDFSGVARSIDTGHLQALAISAAGYSSARSITFFQAAANLSGWQRVKRAGVATMIELDHLMASVAVPFLFPPVVLNDEYFGDGSMRQATPFSSAIHLGADRLLVIGTRNDAHEHKRVTPKPALRSPSFGQIFGYMLDALFSDGLYSDMERLQQMNAVLRKVGPQCVNDVVLKPVESLVILPSQNLSTLARAHVQALPRTLRTLLRSMGAMNTGGGELMSYLMFQGSFTRELIALGYSDAMARSEEIIAFLNGESLVVSGAPVAINRLRSEGLG
jgi:NTE family protein